ncbi:tRNA synthetases class I-domain-containing protein [Phycomyces blakesleeanus]|uniref:valine--tRNA ligase n=1 Tax=Phycomyces blakesleeanus TaxID=4837 RepID=A0ABR3AK73_PHYBL
MSGYMAFTSRTIVRQNSFTRASRPWALLRNHAHSDRTLPVKSLPKPQKPFLDAYDAKIVEKDWYEWWESQGFFTASSADYYPPSGKENPFTMITPPPNVTGSLHIGHALTVSVEDAVARWRRMSGYDVRWIPGTDHAGIGTQSVVEKMLMRDRGLSRHDLGRKEFVDEVWAWRQKYGDRILHQMRRMGASVDWDNLFFTMDKPRYEAVENAFIRLYKDGMIYRDTRLVNWCCELETVISDIEVDYKDIDGRTLLQLPGRTKGVEFGVLHHFSYPIHNPDPNGIKEITVATTRIETMLGDCAVAIHPNDTRYTSLHGKQIYHPILKKTLPIVCDESLVEMEFGTGVVKVTPAHDPNDYACAKRHGLPITSMFDKLGKLNPSCGIPSLVGNDRFEARDIVVDMLKASGHYKGRDDKHVMRVAICSRSGDVIEPLLQPQWYIRCKEMADMARKQVESGEMNIMPKHHVQEWYRWLDSIQDWCISRQLWWGHEIPAYKIRLNTIDKKEFWVVGSTETEARQEAIALLAKEGLETENFDLVKDDDVLDTWFSSGLLPLSALGWKGRIGEPIPARYPLQLMETGYDILFFWVARMAMLASHFTKKPAFEDIYLHAMVRDGQGRKMSKSLGNVIDPLHVIEGVDLETMKNNLLVSNLAPKEITTSSLNLEKEYPTGIPACGTDSLRFALVAYTQQTRQINLEMSNVIQTAHFCNKLWNLFKFGLGRLGPADGRPMSQLSPAGLSLVNRYILSRMAETVRQCQTGFESYRLFDATDALRRFIVEDVCDVYVEFSKAALNRPKHGEDQLDTRTILHACMDVSLRLAHPFMPFVTEELWQHLKHNIPPKEQALQSPTLMLEQYPTPNQFECFYDSEVENHFKVVLSIIHASRSLRQGHQISVAKELPFTILCDNPDLMDPKGPLYQYLDEIKGFIKASELNLVSSDVVGADAPEGWTSKPVTATLKILVPTAAVIRAQVERAIAHGEILSDVIGGKKGRLNKKLDKVRQDIEKMNVRMTKSGYPEGVPIQVQQKNRLRLDTLQSEQKTIEQDMKLLDIILSHKE